MISKIYFKGNPYPLGHQLKEFVWSGRLQDGKGLIFDFHLKTENYGISKTISIDTDDTPDWEARGVWENYGQCTMSSTHWDGHGILVGTKVAPFNFHQILDRPIVVDLLPEAKNYPLRALGINLYLLGHDDCANHIIEFVQQYDRSTFDIKWNGNIALTYAGENEFKHEFEANIYKTKFAGIAIDPNLNEMQNLRLLKECLSNYADFVLVDGIYQYGT